MKNLYAKKMLGFLMLLFTFGVLPLAANEIAPDATEPTNPEIALAEYQPESEVASESLPGDPIEVFKDGKLVERTNFDKDGNKVSTEVFDEKNGKLVERTSFDKDGNQVSTEYFDKEDGDPTETMYFDKDGKLTQHDLFDKDGKLETTEKLYYDADGKRSRIDTYDANGNLIKQAYY